MVTILKLLYTNIEAVKEINGMRSNIIKITMGVLQGDSVSPLLLLAL